MAKYILTALSLSPSSGFLRIILDEGGKVGLMLKQFQNYAGKELPAPVRHQLQSILAAFDATIFDVSKRKIGVAAGQKMTEKLSKRELEVLKLIASGHSNGEIGEQLTIAESTVKWHAKNIFGKLGVKNRTSAVRAAQQLQLINSQSLL